MVFDPSVFESGVFETGDGGTPDPSEALVVALMYEGDDIFGDVIPSSARFTSAANGVGGTCVFRVRDAEHTYAFSVGKRIQLRIEGEAYWTGYISSVRRGFFIIDADNPDTRVRYLEISGVDVNVLFRKRILYDKANPTTLQLTTFPADTADDVILKAYMDNHLDLDGDGIGQSLIEHVGTPATDSEISGNGSWTWQNFMQMLTYNTRALYYLDPDREMVLTDVDTPNAPYGLSDRPGEGQVGYREMELTFDGTSLRNDALIWGVGQGAVAPVFSRVTDEDSIAEHGLWQVGQFNQSVWRQATVDRIADSHVYGSPQSRRGGKDDAVQIRCTVYRTGFKVGQKVVFESEVFGFSDTIPIRVIEVDFPTTRSHPRFVLSITHEIDPPWSTFEFWVPDFNLPDFPLPTFVVPDIPVILPPETPCDEGGGLLVGGIHGCAYTQTERWDWDDVEYEPYVYDPPRTVGPRWDVTAYGFASQYAWFMGPSTGPTFSLSGPSTFQGGTLDPSRILVSISATNKGYGESYAIWENSPFGPIWSYLNWHMYIIWHDINGDPISSTELWSHHDVRSDEPPKADFSNAYAPAGATGFTWYWDNGSSSDWSPPPGSFGAMTDKMPVIVDDVIISVTWFYDACDNNSSAGAMVLPTGEVVVYADGVELTEGVDYEIEQTAGSILVRPIGSWPPGEITARLQPEDPTVCEGATPVGPTSGSGAEIDPPSGEDPDDHYFAFDTSWTRGTERVWLDGFLLRRDVDYTANSREGWIAINAAIDVDGKTVYITFYADPVIRQPILE